MKFPIDVLYRDNKCYVPALISDEIGTLMPEKNPAFDFCESVYYMAYRDGKPVGRIIYPPYDLPIEAAPGKHEIEVTLFLHRYNTFGPLHLVNEHESWHGPGAWRTEDENWSEQYVLRRTGVMKSPEIFIETE